MLQAGTLDGEARGRGIEKRRAFRISNPVLSVEIAGRRYSTVNWSLDGLLLNGLPGGAEVDMPVDGIMGPIGAAEMCRFAGKIVRLDAAGMTTAIELDEKSADVAALLPLWVLKYGAR
ncbi:hypothetical protein [Sneathiella sp.]|uniref:hypothetical protein n=1 Tax=Sneathiella sp. TaxID=1964365 RepID=UPI002FE10A78